jgi:hypothetical protein
VRRASSSVDSQQLELDFETSRLRAMVYCPTTNGRSTITEAAARESEGFEYTDWYSLRPDLPTA